jgi:hypothetical protein
VNLTRRLRLASCTFVACFAIAVRGQGTLRTVTFDGPPRFLQERASW